MTVPLSPRINRALYTLLLIITPFLLLQNYLQEMMGIISRLKVPIGDMEVAVIPVLAAAVVLATAWAYRKQLTTYRIVVFFVIIALDYIGQNSTDYYYNHKFYDLQHNWHYIAYGLFGLVMYRELKPKGISSEKIILKTYLTALVVSTFDEVIQVFISNRVFDVCDIGKDMWGTVIGLVLVFFLVEQGAIARNGWKLRQQRIKDYLKNPLSLLFLQIVHAYTFLVISSNISDPKFWYLAFTIPIAVFFIIFLIFHATQFRVYRYMLIGIGSLILIVQTFFFIKYRDEGIVYNAKGLIVYKGIPIPYFDVMIRPNGTFRIVDKKHSFNRRDMNFLHTHSEDILLIGSGMEGQGGLGLPEMALTQFQYNKNTLRGLQIIVLKNTEACEVFNRLKKEGKSVLFIIHNT